MIVLGISGGVKIGNQDGAAALLIDGQLVAAAEEERFLGVKFANGTLPASAVRYCLQAAGIQLQQVDQLVFPGATYAGFEDVLRRYFEFRFGYAPPIELVDHHLAHAASTFYGSGWDNALVVTADFSGDGTSTAIFAGGKNGLSELERYPKPNSLGVFYSCVTQWLGFQKDSDEYKVMGMAAHGRPLHNLSHVLEVTDRGYELHDEFTRGLTPGSPAPSKQERLFDEFPLPWPARLPGDPIDTLHFDVAASAQQQLEQAMSRVVARHVSATGLNRLCLAGGVALNCKMNQVLRESLPLESVYVPPVASDAGLALGAAFLAARRLGDTITPLPHAYWGPEFSESEVRTTLDRAGARYRHCDDPLSEAVRLLTAGRIVGWFQGHMEYGPRALGNRSILADPRRADMQDLINKKVKFREEFRPIAPAVLHEQGANYFAGYADSPYMTQTFDALPVTRSQAPAIVHRDGTCRLQSVHRATNPRFHDLISRFAATTGLPMLVNTSLNAYNDPMACEPFQALRTYFTTGLDALFLGDLLLEK